MKPPASTCQGWISKGCTFTAALPPSARSSKRTVTRSSTVPLYTPNMVPWTPRRTMTEGPATSSMVGVTRWPMRKPVPRGSCGTISSGKTSRCDRKPSARSSNFTRTRPVSATPFTTRPGAPKSAAMRSPTCSSRDAATSCHGEKPPGTAAATAVSAASRRRRSSSSGRTASIVCCNMRDGAGNRKGSSWPQPEGHCGEPWCSRVVVRNR
mmetsp:Transcript_101905/g.287567  ORF Transcript_101905/g.287567 Transcript_101905/m.287567 type:complete len:210 (+) Transcript_101905:332-961(+)